VGMLLCSPAGNDLLFDESYCEQGRNFSNKIWNAFRLVKGWNVDENFETPQGNFIAIDWFSAKFNEESSWLEDQYKNYRISEALMITYKLFWDDFCSMYLEMIKPEFTEGKSKPIDSYTYNSTIEFFEDLLKLIHPFMPFITEEIWHLIRERKESDCIIISEWPKAVKYDKDLLKEFENGTEIIGPARDFKKEKNISNKDHFPIIIYQEKKEFDINKYKSVIQKLTLASEIREIKVPKQINTQSFIPIYTSGVIHYYTEYCMSEEQRQMEKEKLLKELEYYKGFLQSVQKKLANEKFVLNANPEVLTIEKKKQADAEAKIKALEEQLAALK
jgi:valyl-tRNA synthetase